MKDIDTLVPDIQKLFDGHGFSDAIEKFSSDLGETFKERFKEYGESRKASLRLSNYGRPLRQLWYEINEYPREPLSASSKFKFLYGHILESLLLTLAIEAGHTVESLQRTVEVDGVAGHLDAVIDNVLIDVKSASTFSFKKFVSGGLRDVGGDPFGYIPQLAAYSLGLGGIPGAFLVVDKTLGHIHLDRFSKEELAKYDVRGRIAEDRAGLASTTEPERCYEAESYGKSGNEILGVPCSYCGWKSHCWRDSNNGEGLKTYAYSNGVKFFTKVLKEPRVEKEEWVSFPTKA